MVILKTETMETKAEINLTEAYSVGSLPSVAMKALFFEDQP